MFSEMLSVLFSSISSEAVNITESHELLFILYFTLNILDLLTGVMQAVSRGTFEIKKFYRGIIVKVGRWSLIIVAMIVHISLLIIGGLLEMDLHVTKTLVWFVLIALMFQEVRSVFGNLTALGVEIPKTLIKALSLAEGTIEQMYDGDMNVTTSDDGKIVYRLDLNGPVEELETKDKLVFHVKKTDNESPGKYD